MLRMRRLLNWGSSVGGIWNKRDLDGTRLPPGLPCGCGSPEGGDGRRAETTSGLRLSPRGLRMDCVPVKWVENDLDKKLENGRLNGNYFASAASITANKIITKKACARLCERASEREVEGQQWVWGAVRLGGRLHREMLINELIKDEGK